MRNTALTSSMPTVMFSPPIETTKVCMPSFLEILLISRHLKRKFLRVSMTTLLKRLQQ